MIDLQEFVKMRATADRLKQEAARAEGEALQLRRQLVAEFGQEAVEDGEGLLQRLQAAADEAEAAYNELAAAFKRDFGDKL